MRALEGPPFDGSRGDSSRRSEGEPFGEGLSGSVGESGAVAAVLARLAAAESLALQQVDYIRAVGLH